jgi:hypothetical protein
MKKICGKCNQEKSIESFYKDKSKRDGRHSNCKDCVKLYQKENTLKIKQRKKEYRQENREVIRAYEKEYREENRNKIREINQRSYNKHKTKRQAEQKEYRKKNNDIIFRRRYKWEKSKLKTDLNFKLAKNIRARLKQAIKDNQRAGSAISDLGCSIEELKLHLEKQFQDEMSWENWGLYGWHIDHIIPLSSFDLSNREQFLKACHYTNLQPLWATDNLKKGGQ